jgi:hypothetical protein
MSGNRDEVQVARGYFSPHKRTVVPFDATGFFIIFIPHREDEPEILR